MKLCFRLSNLCFTAVLLQFILCQSVSAQTSKDTSAWHVRITAKSSSGSVQNYEVPVDYYISKDRICFERRGSLNILRFDMLKHWRIQSDKKTYSERALGFQDTAVKKMPISKAGYEYEPEYYWEIKDAEKDTVINGWKCHSFIAYGDADYSDRTVYLWLTNDLPAELEILNDKNFRGVLIGTEVSDKLFDHIKALKKGVAVYSKDCENPSIPNTIYTLEHRVEIIEPAKETNLTFELPDGLKKLN